MSLEAINNFNVWKSRLKNNSEFQIQLSNLESNPDDLDDAFRQNIKFGTGGIRGRMGIGPNRINIFTVSRATLGLAKYIFSLTDHPSVVIGYDTRKNSYLYARTAAKILTDYGVEVFFWKDPLPVSLVSYSVPKLNATAGIMITASHNPADYNGYKVYGSDGCQITVSAADQIYRKIEMFDPLDSYPQDEFCDLFKHEKFHFMSNEVYSEYLNDVRLNSFVGFSPDDTLKKDLSIVYSPLNGTGLKPVKDILSQAGYTNLLVVPEQEHPDEDFRTCSTPNPQEKSAMELALNFGKKNHAELIFATDPDCDRIGVITKTKDNQYVQLTGNQLGILLLEYIIQSKTEHKLMPNNPILYKSVVTTKLADRIALQNNIEIENVLTGFKFIGEKIVNLEMLGQNSRYLFGFEESCGYLSGNYVHDKDGVNSALLVADMAAYYKNKGITLNEQLDNIYRKYGYLYDAQYHVDLPNRSGLESIERILEYLRGGSLKIPGFKIIKIVDYIRGIDDLPKTNLLEFILEDQSIIQIRPSGTEPKLKIYIFASGSNMKEAKEINLKLYDKINNLISGIINQETFSENRLVYQSSEEISSYNSGDNNV